MLNEDDDVEEDETDVEVVVFPPLTQTDTVDVVVDTPTLPL